MAKNPDEICPECGSDLLLELDMYWECDECGHTWKKDNPDEDDD